MHAETTAGAGETLETADGSERAFLYVSHFRWLTVAQVVRLLIEDRIRANDGNKSAAARTLGLSLKTLYNRLNSYKADSDGGDD